MPATPLTAACVRAFLLPLAFCGTIVTVSVTVSVTVTLRGRDTRSHGRVWSPCRLELWFMFVVVVVVKEC